MLADVCRQENRQNINDPWIPALIGDFALLQDTDEKRNVNYWQLLAKKNIVAIVAKGPEWAGFKSYFHKSLINFYLRIAWEGQIATTLPIMEKCIERCASIVQQILKVLLLLKYR